MSDINLELLSDEELITYYKQGNTFAYEILHKRYKTLIASMTRRYFLVGGDQDDLIQEASIALFNAINSFNGKKSFKNFALTCIQNKLKTTIKTSLRKKNLPLYNYLSLSGDSDNDVDKSSIIISNDIGPEEIIINEFGLRQINKLIKNQNDLSKKGGNSRDTFVPFTVSKNANIVKDVSNLVDDYKSATKQLNDLDKVGKQNLPIYSDSRTAIAWVKKKHAATKLIPDKENGIIFDLIRRAENWLLTHSYVNPIYKWDTDNWGEVPADFGRK